MTTLSASEYLTYCAPEAAAALHELGRNASDLAHDPKVQDLALHWCDDHGARGTVQDAADALAVLITAGTWQNGAL
jgi:hypothetical protein